MSRIYDISMTIKEDMQVWKNSEHKQPSITNVQNHQQGKPHESKISLNVHTGTHVDAPLHMLENGATIETITMEQLVGTARVLDLTKIRGEIARQDLLPFNIQEGERILLKTANSFTEAFDPEFIYLREDGAAYLAELNVSLVGIDALGIERSQPGYPTHRTLMGRNIVIVEGLRLQDVPPGAYTLIVAPLKLTGIDAAPARVLLIDG
ncbi:cyclase [Paenibacillus agaridevorans]|uniref:Kynurenine formamidase n=1 Tax=Paenibacillus agaridevorans TaxID=171404 RepID=A0A2R5EVN2_9BACL|nr:cyclase family protein [Paenibacillus agaridevorans]GBG07853.1 cyclase [Paenibacillus agaridevorans]